MKKNPRVLAIDIGGTSIKILASGQTEPRKFPSGKGMTPRMLVAGVKKIAKDWSYDVIAIGYPGVVRKGRPAAEPRNLAKGWVGFDFAATTKRFMLPEGCRLGNNANASPGGFRLWEEPKQ